MLGGEMEGAETGPGSWGEGKSPGACTPTGAALGGSPSLLPWLCGAVRAGAPWHRLQLLWHEPGAEEWKVTRARRLQGELLKCC